MLLEIHNLGRASGRWALGENWPFSPQEFDWEAGRRLDEGRRVVAELLDAMRQGRGDEILVHPLTRRPLKGG
jgi:hypothetical protein